MIWILIMGDIALRGNRLTAAKGGRIGLQSGGPHPENVKSTPDVIKRKSKAAKAIHKFVKKHGGTKADEAAGAKLKGGK